MSGNEEEYNKEEPLLDRNENQPSESGADPRYGKGIRTMIAEAMIKEGRTDKEIMVKTGFSLVTLSRYRRRLEGKEDPVKKREANRHKNSADFLRRFPGEWTDAVNRIRTYYGKPPLPESGEVKGEELKEHHEPGGEAQTGAGAEESEDSDLQSDTGPAGQNDSGADR